MNTSYECQKLGIHTKSGEVFAPLNKRPQRENTDCRTVVSAVRSRKISQQVLLMARRSSPNQISNPDDLQRLSDIVVDKRFGKRAKAKKNRRNRHYEKQFMRNAVSNGILTGVDTLDDSDN